MLDLAWTEILIIAMVAILVVGPRELPRMLRGIGNFMGMVRRTAGDFQRQFNDALKETELDEVRRGFDSVRKANPINKFKDDLNPLKNAGDEMRKSVEGAGRSDSVKKASSSAAGAGDVGAGHARSPAARPSAAAHSDPRFAASPAPSIWL